MNNYDFITNLFKTNLAASPVIQGRFHIGYRYGLQDANYDALGEVLSAISSADKYPLVMMAPPHSQYKVSGGHSAFWEEYRIIMFFVKLTYYSESDGVISLDTRTRTSQYTVPQVWDDMKNEAYEFFDRLRVTERNQAPAEFVLPAHLALMVPISNVGADRVSGIRVDFDLKVFNGC